MWKDAVCPALSYSVSVLVDVYIATMDWDQKPQLARSPALLKCSNKSTSKMQPKHAHRMHLNAVIKYVFPQRNGPYTVVTPAKQDNVLICMEVEGVGKGAEIGQRSRKRGTWKANGQTSLRVSFFLSFFLFFSGAV
jgi:hypothetical protein